MSKERAFRGIWIPAEIWLNESLSALDKVIFAEIDSLDNEDGCTAGNAYIAKFCQCSESKVSKSIKVLIEFGYIEQVSFDGRRRVLRSCLVKNARQTSKEYEAAEQKMPAINIGINKDINKRERVRFAPPALAEVADYCEERGNGIDPQRFIDYYESNGWKVGRNPMKDWRAAVRNWEKREGGFTSRKAQKPAPSQDDYDLKYLL